MLDAGADAHDEGLSWTPWRVALTRFSAASGLAATLYDAAGVPRLGPIAPLPLHQLFLERGLWRAEGPGRAFELRLTEDCLRTRAGAEALFDDFLRVRATPIHVRGVRTGAMVYGWVPERFGSTLECDRLSPLLGISGFELWSEVRKTQPVSAARFSVSSDLIDALVASTASHAEALADLRALGQLRDVFLAHVAHELRSPLNAISLRVSTLLETPLADPAHLRQQLEAISRSCFEEARLIEDLIEAAQTSTGHLQIAPEDTRLGEIIARAVESVLPRALEKGINLRVVTTPDDTLVADPSRLQQVFVNLLGNATKFTPADGVILVESTSTPTDCEVRVTDSGSGIAPEMLPQIFDAFAQSTPGSHKGFGLGLSVARQLVAGHGGTIHAESAGLGQGATFVVRLPRIKAD